MKDYSTHEFSDTFRLRMHNIACLPVVLQVTDSTT